MILPYENIYPSITNKEDLKKDILSTLGEFDEVSTVVNVLPERIDEIKNSNNSEIQKGNAKTSTSGVMVSEQTSHRFEVDIYWADEGFKYVPGSLVWEDSSIKCLEFEILEDCDKSLREQFRRRHSIDFPATPEFMPDYKILRTTMSNGKTILNGEFYIPGSPQPLTYEFRVEVVLSKNGEYECNGEVVDIATPGIKVKFKPWR